MSFEYIYLLTKFFTYTFLYLNFKKVFFYDLVRKKLQKNQNYQKIEKTLQN